MLRDASGLTWRALRCKGSHAAPLLLSESSEGPKDSPYQLHAEDLPFQEGTPMVSDFQSCDSRIQSPYLLFCFVFTLFALPLTLYFSISIKVNSNKAFQGGF